MHLLCSPCTHLLTNHDHAWHPRSISLSEDAEGLCILSFLVELRLPFLSTEAGALDVWISTVFRLGLGYPSLSLVWHYLSVKTIIGETGAILKIVRFRTTLRALAIGTEMGTLALVSILATIWLQKESADWGLSEAAIGLDLDLAVGAAVLAERGCWACSTRKLA